MAGKAKRKGGLEKDQDQLISRRRYRKMVIVAAASVSAVAVVPLLIMSGITYHQYQEVIRAELTRPCSASLRPGRCPWSPSFPSGYQPSL